MVEMMTEQMALWFQLPMRHRLRWLRFGCWQRSPCWRWQTLWRQNRRRFWWSVTHCRRAMAWLCPLAKVGSIC